MRTLGLIMLGIPAIIGMTTLLLESGYFTSEGPVVALNLLWIGVAYRLVLQGE